MYKPFTEINIDNGLLIIKSENLSDRNILLNTKKTKLFIQFHFNLSGEIFFSIIKGTHKLELIENESLFFFNPKNIIPIEAIIKPKSKMVSILLSLDAIHKLLENFSIDFSFFNSNNTQKKLYQKRQLTANELIIINQINNRKIINQIDYIYIKAKIIEFFTFFFCENFKSIKTKTQDIKYNIINDKIKLAKNLLIENINEPPTIEVLANRVMLPVNILKKGFKDMYGLPIYQFILNYRLELARKLLMSKKYSVKEISYQMGYSAPTHFIVAFKKKFGITPKKYTQNL